MIKVRKGKKEDSDEIIKLLIELGRPKPNKDFDVDVFQNLVRKYLSDDDKDILVAEQDTNIVGMASLMFLPRLNQKYFELYIPELIISKKSQNKGIGKELIKVFLDIAKEKKCHRIRLESGNQRKESHIFYKKLGFEQSALSFSKELK